jgi:hypothetical protein
VQDYRLYMLDHRGKITRAIDMRAATDSDAVRRALEADNHHGMELWQGGRQVRVFSPEGRGTGS